MFRPVPIVPLAGSAAADGLASAACQEASRLFRPLRAGHRGPATKGTPPRNAMPRRRALRGAAPEPGHSPTAGLRLDLRQGSCGTAVQIRQSRRPGWAGGRSPGHSWFTQLSLWLAVNLSGGPSSATWLDDQLSAELCLQRQSFAPAITPHDQTGRGRQNMRVPACPAERALLPSSDQGSLDGKCRSGFCSCGEPCQCRLCAHHK